MFQDGTHLTGLLQQHTFPLDHDVDPLGLPLPDQLRGRAHTPDTKQHTNHQVSIFNTWNNWIPSVIRSVAHLCCVHWLHILNALKAVNLTPLSHCAVFLCALLCVVITERQCFEKTRQETGKPHVSTVMSPWQQVRMLSVREAWRRQVAVCSAGPILILHCFTNS